MLGKNGLLYPMLLIVAISVIIFSALGVATLTGLIPTAQSDSVQQPEPRPKTQPQSVQPPAKRAAPTRTVGEKFRNVNGQAVAAG